MAANHDVSCLPSAVRCAVPVFPITCGALVVGERARGGARPLGSTTPARPASIGACTSGVSPVVPLDQRIDGADDGTELTRRESRAALGHLVGKSRL